MKITLLQKCGLGNQLFQYAAGLYFADRYHASLQVIRHGRVPAWELQKRDFLLSNFAISAPVRELTSYDRMMTATARAKRPLAATARALTGTRSYYQPWQIDRTFLADLPVPSSTRSVYLEGFFQAWQFAHHIEPKLRKEFSLREPPTGANLQWLQQIQQCDSAVSVHIRRGDYTVHNNGRYALPIQYFLNCMSAMRERVANPVWFVFSDDIPWVRENLPTLEPMFFADANDQHLAHEDLRLMSACRHHIIANSTFSWWGAWLNPRPDKIVCAPRVWLDPNTHAPDIVPLNWLRISIPSQ
jgi:hypothetical protein